jgi:hypothetical protein
MITIPYLSIWLRKTSVYPLASAKVSSPSIDSAAAATLAAKLIGATLPYPSVVIV